MSLCVFVALRACLKSNSERGFAAVFCHEDTKAHEGSRSLFVSLCVFVALRACLKSNSERGFAAVFLPRRHEGTKAHEVSLCHFVSLWL
ncbi:hypothetical protein [Desulfonema magnum]|uniref:hypothetical protein n=1 Tax=Desulfonema magnum TaxID=45655 RepID=UPI001A9BC349|nr:hypothetical protein [Desulfonema magnum]